MVEEQSMHCYLYGPAGTAKFFCAAHNVGQMASHRGEVPFSVKTGSYSMGRMHFIPIISCFSSWASHGFNLRTNVVRGQQAK